MGHILYLKERRSLKSNDLTDDLNHALAAIIKLSKSLPEEKEGLGPINPYPSLKAWLKKRISREILDRRELSSPIFLCGLYASEILGEADSNMQKYAIDFFEQWADSSDPDHLKKGGDFCFILCSGFPARSNRRTMRMSDYQSLGRGFYQNYYTSTGKPIGYHMSVNFTLMQEIVNAALVKDG